MTINNYAVCKLVKFKDYDKFVNVKKRSHGTIFIDQKNLVAVKKRFRIGFIEKLAIAFVVLKLFKVIDWSWLWVFSSIWIPLALLLLVLVIIYFWAKLTYFWEKLF